MKKLVLLLIALSLWTWVFAQKESLYTPGVLHVEVTPEMAQSLELRTGKTGRLSSASASQGLKTGVVTFDAAISSLKTVEMQRLFPYHPKYENRQRAAGLHRWYTVKIGEGVSPEWAAEKLREDLNDVSYASGIVPVVPFSTPKSETSEEPPVNDPLLGRQWHYNNTGQTGGTPGADINLFEGWKIQKSAENVIVAIIDGGIDTSNPDLVDNLWVNEAELNGMPGVDDDGNGYIDDVYGYNFVINSGAVSAQFHGTHVAGTVAAASNNGIGVAGVAGGTGNKDGARLMSCQIFLQPMVGTSNTAASFVYAANNGAVIAQCSWGSQVADYKDEATMAAIDYFVKNAGKDENGQPLPGTPMVGGIVFFAAGNSAYDANVWPACSDSVVAVAALNHYNRKASYSNYADWVDISAPGGEIPGTSGIVEQAVLSTGYNDPGNVFAGTVGHYAYLEGTSMACPHVSGIAALVLAKFGSENYTPEQLKIRMFNACKSEIYDLNPTIPGKLGKGLIDTRLALESDEGTPPLKIEDLRADMLGKNFVSLIFTAPSDPDNANALHYEVRYSTQPITDANFGSASVIFKTAKPAGEIDTVIISGLTPQKEYYFAIKSADIWGNISELSNVVSATTIDNPSIKVTPDTIIEVTIDASVTTSATEQFRIENIGLGNSSLKYDILHHVNADPRPSSWTDIHRLSSYKEIDGVTYAQGSTIGADSGNTFIAANLMTVTQDVFNLTHVTTCIQTVDWNGNQATEDFIIQIVKGGETPDKGQLLYSEPCRYRSWGLGAYDNVIDLQDQIPFVKGEKFWVVLSFPVGYAEPMGMNWAIQEQYGPSIFSEDDGKTWTNINDYAGASGFGEDYYPILVFRMFAHSRYELLTDYLTCTPPSGYVSTTSPADVTINFDASNSIEGEYNSRIKVISDDVENPLVYVPVKLTITNQPSLYTPSREVVNFGSLLQGNNALEEVVIENNGLGALKITSITSTNPEFVVTSASTMNIAPKQKATLRVRYNASTLGAVTGAIHLKTDKGADHTIITEGSCALPPIGSVNPALLTWAANLDVEVTDQFVIRNTGSSKLVYNMPAYGGVATFAYQDRGTGYTALRSDEAGGPSLSAWDDMSDAIDVTRFAETGKRLHIEDLGFTIRYYGKDYDKVTITPLGYVMMGEATALSGNMSSLPEPNGASKMICFLASTNSAQNATDYVPSEAGGKILYKRFGDYAVVEYKDYGKPEYRSKNMFGWWTTTPATGTIDAQLVIKHNGQMEFRYRNFNETPANKPLFGSIIIGMDNEERNDGIQVMRNDGSFLTSGQDLTIAFYPAGANLVKEVIPSSGIIAPNDSVTITVKMKGEDMLAGNYEEYININTNDPANPSLQVKIEASVFAESRPVVYNDSVDVGTIGKNFTKTVQIEVNNDGGEPYRVMNVTNSKPEFVVTRVATTDSCMGLSSALYKVAFTPTLAQVYEDVIVFETDNPAAQYLRVNIKGEGVANASHTINSPLNMSLTLNGGEYKDTAVIIESTGDAKLDYVVTGTEWLNLNVPAQRASVIGGVDKFGYTWTDSDKDSSLRYEWIDVDNAVEIVDLRSYAPQDYALPFKFNFYGKEYEKLVLSSFGTILFNTEYGDAKTNATDFKMTALPNQDYINNVICLFRANLQMYAGGGKMYAENFDDKVVFTWLQATSGYFTEQQQGTKITAQAILYKDGRIKFQYKDVEDALWRRRSVIGIENHDGTDGLEVALLKSYAHNELAVMITPGKQFDLASGSTHRIPVRVNATDLYDGVYTGKLLIMSNDPVNSVDTLTVNLTVNGRSKIAMADTIDYGKVFSYEESSVYKSYTKTLLIENNGSKEAVFTSVSSLSSSFVVTDMPATPITIEPGKSITVTITYTPQSIPAGNTMEETLVFTYGGDDIGRDEKVVITADVYNPPVVDIDEDFNNKIYSVKLLPSSDAVNKSFKLSNVGLSSLEYKWDVNYIDEFQFNAATSGLRSTPVSKAINNGGESVANGLKTTNVAANSMMSIAPQANYNFVDSLGYNGYKTSTTSVYIGNPDYTWSFASRMHVGAEGFNLTHVANWYKVYATDVQMRIRILAGKDYESAREVYSEIYIPEMNTVENGELEIRELSKSLYFYPGEYFWIAYDLNSTKVQFRLMEYDDAAAEAYGLFESFMLQVGESVGHMSQYMGFIMEAYSIEKQNVESWVKLTPESGQINIGADESINIKVDPSVLPNKYSRYARVDLVSNDPINDTISVYVELGINEGPRIVYAGSIEADTVTYGIEENDRAAFSIEAIDPDGDEIESITVELINSIPGKTPPVTELTKVNSTKSQFTFDVPYLSAGTWKYKFTATDVNGLSNTSQLNLVVYKTNRAPEAIEIPDVELRHKESYTIKLNDYFSDPDGDNVTYTVVSDNEDIAAVHLVAGTDELNILGVSMGAAQITVKAEDEEGAWVEKTFNVNVIARAPIASTIHDLVIVSGNTEQLSLSDYFVDAEGSQLSYTFETTSLSIANVTLNASELTIAATSIGELTITVKATNSYNQSTESSFKVTVIPQVLGGSNGTLVLYPNPVVNSLGLESVFTNSSTVEIRIYNMNGGLMYQNKYAERTHFRETIDVSDYPSGIYVVKYLVNGKKAETKRFIK